MNKFQNDKINGKNILSQTAEKIKQLAEQRAKFEKIKRDFEKAYKSGDFENELKELSKIIVYSVLNKCLDPQRKADKDKDGKKKDGKPSNNGFNPALMELKKSLFFDVKNLENLRYFSENCSEIVFDKSGDLKQLVDKDNMQGVDLLITKNLTDSMDLLQQVYLSILEQAQQYATCDNWLDTEYKINRLSKKVYIHLDDSKAYKEDKTTPIQEVYRSLRRYIMNNQAVKTDPQNSYSYVEDLTENELEQVYYRLPKYFGLGSENSNGNYTTAYNDVLDYNEIIDKLNLTKRQAEILRLRMQGYGERATATYLGVTHQAIQKTIKQIRAKANSNGYNYTYKENEKEKIIHENKTKTPISNKKMSYIDYLIQEFYYKKKIK